MNRFALDLLFGSQANGHRHSRNAYFQILSPFPTAIEDSSTFMYSDFTTVKSRKKRKNKYPKAPPTSDLLAAAREEIRHSEWFAQCSQIIENAWKTFSAVDASTSRTPKVLCLGLGSPSSSQIARVQLAFLAETCKRLNVAHDMVFVYDPVFTPEDMELFTELQMIVLSETRAQRRLCVGSADNILHASL
ncbi:hypothetical protein M413DRAFT_108941 [Hebeloma cylindrosporum]|uniref:SRR1-like domain-containing protein n=1 Tax=Hebeloma cylindrosporum TaxID=76867 RepID=A0A0C3CZ72_HEBCY|nr:hypothetical protein M413DRAFT_108941 [Hebeloma cylindrosporum h7]